MAEEIGKDRPNEIKPDLPDIIKNLPDLSDRGDGGAFGWDRANIEGATTREKQWGHAGIPPPDAPVKQNDDSHE